MENANKKNRRPIIRELTMKNGLSYPSEEELVMLILGSGAKNRSVRAIARDIVDTVLSCNRENLVEELIKIQGVGQNKALAIAAALEFGYRMNRKPQSVVNEPKDVLPYLQSYAISQQEHFLLISLNGSREIISIRVICVGSGNMAVMRPAEIFAEAIKERASAILLSHNHPGGSIVPSKDDMKTTNDLLKVANLLGISLLDHIIISRCGYFSFAEHKMLKSVF